MNNASHGIQPPLHPRFHSPNMTRLLRIVSSLILTSLPALVATACSEPPADPAELQSARALGLAYLEENRLEEAVVEFQRLIEMAPSEPLGHGNLGLAYLRLGRLADAEEHVSRALELEADAEVSMILAEVLLADERPDDARATLTDALDADSLHLRVLYALANLDAESGDPAASARRAERLSRLGAVAPGNAAVRIEFVSALFAAGRVEEGGAELEAVRQLVPEFPVEALDPFDEALLAAEEGDAGSALNAALSFGNAMRTTPAYQRGLTELTGPGGVLVGFPVLTFSENLGEVRSQEAILAALRFTDASAALGLGTEDDGGSVGGEESANGGGNGALALGDFDGDGDTDIHVGGRLLEDRPTGYVDVTAEAGLPSFEDPTGVRFADWDNDGHLDLYVATADGGHLFRNEGTGSFTDVTESLEVELPAGEPLFGDFDHDGDLDLVVAWAGGGTLFRNDLDGTFTDLGERAGFTTTTAPDVPAADGARTIRAAFADLDDDDDLDFVLPDPAGGLRLHDNRRLGLFAEVAAERGLAEAGEGTAGLDLVAAGDYDNDGRPDLLGGRSGGPGVVLLRNRGDGTFTEDTRPTALREGAEAISVTDLSFVDFDNDGWLDIVLGGEADGASTGRALLFRNAAAGRFDPMIGIVPDLPAPVRRIAARDFEADGDLDLFVSLADNSVRLLRNEGGNANHYLKIALVGLSTGSGKNNHHGIGAKVEIRAGGLYQTRTVTEPELHVGLGGHSAADVVRVRWTNGVPQNLFYPRANQSVVEEQILKGSCPFLYAWDGERFAMVTDLMWKSALGMPLGLMAQGLAEFAPPGASQEYLRLPSGALEERDGTYELRVTGELWEIIYMDEVELIAVDHPDSFDVYVDERFAFVTGEVPLELHRVRERRPLAAAVDHRGRDVRNLLERADDRYVAGFVPERYQGVSRLHSLELDLGPAAEGEQVKLFMRGWIFPTDASINMALSQSDELAAIMPYVEVPDGDGWRTVVTDFSFPAGKDKTVIQDLTGLLAPGDPRVRISTTMNIYWDEAFVSIGAGAGPTEIARLEPVGAELRYHGVADRFRRGGPDGPHWASYYEAQEVAPWRPILGNRTRYGDVRELLLHDDSRYPVMGPGDEIVLSFDADELPELPGGWTRDFLIYTTGWLKDADLSTAAGWQVGPLPFHGMSSYPYGADESYPYPALADTLHTRPPADYPALASERR